MRENSYDTISCK